MKEQFIAKTVRKKTLELINSINSILAEYEQKGLTLTLRQVYYQLVARGLCNNSKADYDKISDVVSDGRMLGLIDWTSIEDRTRFIRENAHWTSPQEVIKAAAQQYRINIRAGQPYYLECWVEKDSLISILESVCKPLDVPCFSCRGFASVTALYDAAGRFSEHDNSVILYAGDHDPSGLKIPQVIQDRLNLFGVCVTLERLGLTYEQVISLNLPPYPAKQQDKNFDEYVRLTGLKEAWELDALPPEYLADLFTRGIERYTDFEQLKKLQDLEKQDKGFFNSLCANM